MKSTVKRKGESDRTGLRQVWIMNADGRRADQLTFDATQKDQTPGWSPGGAAFSMNTASPHDGSNGAGRLPRRSMD